MKKILILFLLIAATACSDDISSTYSRKNRVICTFQVASYEELFMVMGSFGQFATVRPTGGRIEMGRIARDETTGEAVLKTQKYPMDALSKDFQFGLGGLIIGTTQFGEYRAYDLACSNCDRADIRLTLRDDGTVVCSKCKIEYDCNNDGVILDKGNGQHAKPRPLYKYPVTYDGMRVSVVN